MKIDHVSQRNVLTIGEAARFLNISRDTLKNHESRGLIQSRRHPINNYRLYSLKDLRAFQTLLDRTTEPKDSKSKTTK